MSKKFLSFLGGGYYKKCIYKCAELPKDKIREYNTYFIQEALTEIFCNDWTEEDEVVIFLTERAKKENWLENHNKKIPNTNTYEHRDGLKHDLLRHNYKFAIKEVNIKDVAIALKGADDNISSIILKNQSSRAAQALREEISLLGALKVSQVEEAKRNIVKIIRKLEQEGVISINKGSEDDILV